MPINISGSTLSLTNRQTNRDILLKFPNGDDISIENGYGWDDICDDLVGKGFVENDQIVISANIKVNKNNSILLFNSI